MTKIWTNEELDFLRANYAEQGATFCAEKLARTRQSVFMKASRLDIKSKTRPHKQKTHEQYENDLFEQEIDYWPIEQYIGCQIPIAHMCLLGHTWIVQPHSILQGHGCPKCAKHGFDQTSPTILYYIKIVKDNETYYKIGITKNSVGHRFREDSDKHITIIKEWLFESGLEAKKQESLLLSIHKKHRQNITGFLKSKGNTELFEFDVLNLDSQK